ncbi:MAG: PD-(D/E)XK nuclease family protein [Burkholderiaceae bacterium]|nr:PD-(D/E)XK nuclease family protein [Burkholderiaceae bacterium]
MLHPTIFIHPTDSFWAEAAQAVARFAHGTDLSGVRVVVPAYAHARPLKEGLLTSLGRNFVAPRIVTLDGWCAQLPPDGVASASEAARLMDLYAELRQHGWLKKLFSARRNTDLMPLAQVLLTLSDELTRALLPRIGRDSEAGLRHWQQALAQLSPAAQRVVSDEAHLVWSIWQAQLDSADPLARRYAQLLWLADMADTPLLWVAANPPDDFESAFLSAYARAQDVQVLVLDWRVPAPLLARAWPELAAFALDGAAGSACAWVSSALRLAPAASLEQEAQRGAQTVIDWLQAGKHEIAVVAQDRVAARRLRALLERAQIFVADETGWKLSTTRAASAVSAWFELVTSRAETLALLDVLKSPFVLAQIESRDAQVMRIELALRRANVSGGWEAAGSALAGMAEQETVVRLARCAAVFAGRKTLAQWSTATRACFEELGIWQALEADAAGAQVLALLETIAADCARQGQEFSFAEWRSFVGMQLESTSFIPADTDRRVAMLTLNGARLRSFDAVLVLGCDAEHLPSQAGESLFFANGVRRELGLDTRETLQLRQLRDFAALLCSNAEVVLSWQEQRSGEPNPVSAWIERLELVLERSGLPALAAHEAEIAQRACRAHASAMPQPVAGELLPQKLSAGAYASLVACPYQFFAGRMLHLSGMEELSDMPEKRDYGDWLHQILFRYHTTLNESPVPLESRAALLQELSAALFEQEAAANAAVLGYYVRWKKAIPAYLAWANQREADGWRFAFGERKFEQVLNFSRGEILLHGRIDRVDESDEGKALLDYKTRSATSLRERLKQGEDRQLAFYSILAGMEFSEAQYVSLDTQGDKLSTAPVSDIAAAGEALRTQLTANLEAIAAGALLPASGVEDVCAFCEMRGLCRKGAW